MAETVIHGAKCVDKAFDSKNAIQYYPGDLVDIDLSDRHQRKLVWLKTLGGRWVFQFDRANSSNTQLRMFFCKECGQPFELLNELGTHTSEFHNKNEKIAKSAKKDNDAEIEAMLLEQQLAKEQAEEQAHTKTLAERFAEQKAQANAV